MRALLLAVLCCYKKPVISHFHCNPKENNRLSRRSLLFWMLSLRVKHIFWVSKSSFECFYFHNMLAKKSSILYNVINEEDVRQKALSADTTDSFDVAYVGRLSEQKDPVRLMKVINSVVRRLPNLKVAIVGSGEMEQEIKAECKHLGIERNVSFMGFMSNPLGVLKSSKVMVMSSKREGTPMCVLEAQALGIPVVSTPTDGINDVISDGENGFLSNDNEELADRIVDIVSSKELFNRLSAASLEKSHKYNDLAAYKHTLDYVYQQCR